MPKTRPYSEEFKREAVQLHDHSCRLDKHPTHISVRFCSVATARPTTRVSGRLSADAKLRIGALVAIDDDVDSTDPDVDQCERAVLARIKEAPAR